MWSRQLSKGVKVIHESCPFMHKNIPGCDGQHNRSSGDAVDNDTFKDLKETVWHGSGYLLIVTAFKP